MRRVFLTMLFMMAAVSMSAQEGAWKGVLRVQGITLPLVFHFDAAGCTMDSPSQGVKGIKAEKTVANGNEVKISVVAIGAVYEGKNYGDSICGTFKQNGMSLPLTLVPGAMEVKRPQTPKPPFPYQEENVSFANGKFVFHGTLVLPKDYTKKTPVVLMVTGSGQQNRDEEIFNHKPFAVIADALARQGIASLRYDDRGFGDKSVKFTDFTTKDFKQDAEAGVKFLRTRFGKVGVLGHSEGGTIALMLAAEKKVDFIVSLAGMAVSAKETLLAQNRQGLAPLGFSEDKLDACCKALDKMFDALAKGKEVNINDYEVPAELKPVLEQAWAPMETPYMKYFVTIDVSKQLQKIKCPVLALNGKKDLQVFCEPNVKALENGLGACKHNIYTMDGLNHLFQHCETGSIVEYQQTEETISPEVLNIITAWIQKTL